MTQEDDLLLKDLCGRLPYDIMVDCEGYNYILNEIDPACKDIDYITVRIQDIERLMCAKSVMIKNIKPFLRPLSSMTEKEKLMYEGLMIGTNNNVSYMLDVIDWLNSHHFDYRGLIEKGLAIEVTKENNPYNVEDLVDDTRKCIFHWIHVFLHRIKSIIQVILTRFNLKT